MECFLLCDDSSIDSKWSLLKNYAGDCWADAPVVNGDLQLFLNMKGENKVVILAAHCLLKEDGSDRLFYSFETECSFTYKELEMWFENSATPVLFIWFLTCENANADVLVQYWNANNDRAKGDGRMMVPRCITDPARRKDPFVVSDKYISFVLSSYFKQTGDIPFPDKTLHNNFEDNRLEIALCNVPTDDGEEDTVYYGKGKLTNVGKWILEMRKNHGAYVGAATITSGSESTSEMVEWKSSASSGDYKSMVIHAHVIKDSKNANKRMLTVNGSIHAKPKRMGGGLEDIPKQWTLYSLLTEEGTKCINDSEL